ncbi:2-oxo-tetronate isomerase [Sphingomonas sp. Tas61C01]|uniref:2-oxo-tetronate isomerase n=1 Tax=Sphingomonas sp. Tas61C01 TaxID=3458297 RepID=UPI00403E9566
MNMVKLAANLTMMFQDRPFLERIDAAAAAGFKAVECVAPYVVPAEEIADRLTRLDLQFALFNMPAGDWAGGDRGVAADPRRQQEFADGLETTLHYALTTRTPVVHLMAGKMPADADRSAWADTLIENVRRASDLLGPHGITIVLEPINTRVDMPGYFYDRTDAVLEVMDAVERDNVRLLYDIYHMQIMEGDLSRTIERLLPRIGHIQLADNPGRHEPGTGEINFPWLLSRIDALGYQGWIGCEYAPAGDTLDGLDWAKSYLSQHRIGGTA